MNVFVFAHHTSSSADTGRVSDQSVISSLNPPNSSAQVPAWPCTCWPTQMRIRAEQLSLGMINKSRHEDFHCAWLNFSNILSACIMCRALCGICRVKKRSLLDSLFRSWCAVISFIPFWLIAQTIKGCFLWMAQCCVPVWGWPWLVPVQCPDMQRSVVIWSSHR